MIVGIDTGGTTIDAVGISDGSVVVREKRPKAGHRSDLEAVLEAVSSGPDAEPVDRVVVATTIVMNAAVEGRLPRCSALLVPGPGLAPDRCFFAEENHVLPGAVDHRGRITEEVDGDVPVTAQVTAIAAKFAPRNPELERSVRAHAGRSEDRVATSHEAGSGMTYPERTAATVANAKAKPTVAEFREALDRALQAAGIDAPVFFLTGDGGMLGGDATVTAASQLRRSGVAASTIGLLALTDVEDAVCIDIGGTTTDVARVENGFLAIDEEEGQYPGVRSTSIPWGGDTAVDERGGTVEFTGRRAGDAAAFGGPRPTFADALHVAGRFTDGDEEAAERAFDGFDAGSRTIADDLMETYVERVSDIVERLAGPVTDTLVLGGVLADPLAQPVADACEWIDRVRVPDLAPVAGAVGCAVARVSLEVDVHIDTDQGRAAATALGQHAVEEIEPGKRFDDESALIDFATRRARAAATAADVDPAATWDVEILDRYNVVRDRRVRGEVARLRARLPPGYESIETGDPG